MNKTFEDFLRGKHAAEVEGTVPDDDMPDDFDRWLENVGLDELIKYGNEFANAIRKDLPDAKFPF